MSKILKDQIKDLTGSIIGIHVEKVQTEDSFMDIASRFADLTGTVILMSGTDLDCSRYHILATLPWMTFSGRGKRMKISSLKRSIEIESDPFETLRLLLDTFKILPERSNQVFDVPIAAGLFGYLSYDLKDFLEDLPRTSIDDINKPNICLFAPSIILVHDKISGDSFLCSTKLETEGIDFASNPTNKFLDIIQKKLIRRRGYIGNLEFVNSSFTRENYIKAVEAIKEYIASGHVYEVNLSQRFEAGFEGDAFSLFQDLYKLNPAPFYSFIQTGEITIVSTSPERFILREGLKIETRPIKGTKPRGRSFAPIL